VNRSLVTRNGAPPNECARVYRYRGEIVADGKGLLAIDESTSTCNKRFAKWGIPQTAETRRKYRELIVSTPGLGESISGAILTTRPSGSRRTMAPRLRKRIGVGIIPGIKVDTGAKEMAACPGEKITEGLDGLRARLAEYFQMGARFAKWRAVFAIGDGIPSQGCIEANAHALGRYAALCQEAGLVPVIEPEVLMDGAHTLRTCGEVTEEVLRAVFIQMHLQRVKLEGLILKPNMVLPGSTCPKQETVDEVADATVRCFAADRSCCRSRGRIPVGRPNWRTCLGPFERHEPPIQISAAAGAGVFVRACHPGAGFGDMAW